MADPARVRAFLDVAGRWDPTLAFVMAGALVPMAIAWRVQARMRRPAVAPSFGLPGARCLDVRLFAGAALFGVGWGAAGLCPGPALADLALAPGRAGLFVAAMLAGMGLHAATPRRFGRLAGHQRATSTLKEDTMKNMGAADRVVRLLLVAAITAAYLSGAINGTVALVLGAVGIVFVLTSLFATCPAYMPFRISTRGRR